MPEHIRALFSEKPSSMSDSQFGAWKVRFTAECSNLVQNVTSALHLVDQKKFQGAPTVNAADTRLKDKAFFAKNK